MLGRDCESEALAAQLESVRLAAENSYLSWCRNGYLATVLAVSVRSQQMIPGVEEIAGVSLVMAGLQMSIGSSIYLLHLWQHRHLHQKAWGGTLRTVASAVGCATHLALWFTVFLVYYYGVEIEVQIVDIDEPFDDDDGDDRGGGPRKV